MLTAIKQTFKNNRKRQKTFILTVNKKNTKSERKKKRKIDFYFSLVKAQNVNKIGNTKDWMLHILNL